MLQKFCIDFTDVTATAAAFAGCTALTEFRNMTINGENGILKSNLELKDSNISQESVNQLLETLADGVEKTITFSATSYSYITEEQKEAATAKGWTINQA